MAGSGFSAARKYAYSNARVKAMESKLVGKELMSQIAAAKEQGAALSILMQTDYRDDLEEFGGVNIKGEMIDFALSRNLAKRISTLPRIAPVGEGELISAVVGIWGINNIKLAIYAKAQGKKFDDISQYVVDIGVHGPSSIRQAMSEPTVESMMERMMVFSPYRAAITAALAEYMKEKSPYAASYALERGYNASVSRAVRRITLEDPGSARIIKADIDMKNILALMRSKRRSLRNDLAEALLIDGGSLGKKGLAEAYSISADVESLMGNIKAFGLEGAIARYRESGQLLSVEMHMRAAIFDMSMKLLRHSVLSFGTLVAYAYIKEIEVFSLRAMVKGKEYGLDGFSGIVIGA